MNFDVLARSVLTLCFFRFQLKIGKNAGKHDTFKNVAQPLVIKNALFVLSKRLFFQKSFCLNGLSH